MSYAFIDYSNDMEQFMVYREVHESNAVLYPAIGAANEAGELLGKIKKMLRGDEGYDLDDPEFREALLDEAGDVLWYLTSLAYDLGSNIEYVAQRNRAKLTDRHGRGVLKGDGDKR